MGLFLLMTSALWAGEGGSLLGTVTDPAGKAVPSARVTAISGAVKESVDHRRPRLLFIPEPAGGTL